MQLAAVLYLHNQRQRNEHRCSAAARTCSRVSEMMEGRHLLAALCRELQHDERNSKPRAKEPRASQGEDPHLPPLRHELGHDGQQAAARPPQRCPLPLRQRNGLLRPRYCYW